MQKSILLIQKGWAHLACLSVLVLCGSFAAAQRPTPSHPQKVKVATPMATMSPGQVGMGGMEAAGMTPPSIMVGQGGRWVIGYQYSFDKFKGNLVGTSHISTADILKTFAAAPTDMTMQMQMGMVMYAPTAKLTLAVGIPYSHKVMNHLASDGTHFTERTSGLGDIELHSLYSIHAGNTKKNLRHRFLLNTSVGLPTGSINRTMGGMRLEYPMQQGAGTVSLVPGLTYVGEAPPWGWGAEFLPTVRVGRNSNGYRLGNRYQESIWGARQLKSWLSLSGRLNGNVWQNIRGADPMLNPADEPTKDPNLQGGRRLDVAVGVDVHPVGGFLKGSELYVDGNVPIFQSLDGPQLQKRWGTRLGLQWEF